MSADFLPPSKETVQRVWLEFGLNDRSIKEAVDMIKEWLKSQPHLPNVDDDKRLERWLIRCMNSLEMTKQAIDMYYTLKTMTPELMSGWDTTSNWFKSMADIMYFVPMPQLTPDCSRVIVIGFQTLDATKFIVEDYHKIKLMSFEILSCEDYFLSNTYIFDLTNCTAGHIQKMTLTSIKKFEVCVADIIFQSNAIHVISNSPYADNLIRTMKSIFHSEIASKMYIHNDDLTSLREQVPKECLPKEYGGEAGSIQENWSHWKKKLESYQNWYQENENLKSDEQKRPGGVIDISKYFGFEISFRKLNVG